MATCPKCHHDVTPGASFCGSCGAAVVAPQLQGAPHDPFIGQTFKGTYFVEVRIGGGGMGDVYRARHVTLDAPIAIKLLKRSLLSDPSLVQRFHREARSASRLRHPNVISVTDFGETEDGTLYMAMEYVAGKSLAQIIAEEFPFPERRIVHIGQQILSALSEAHANDILHRDLKPENVMLEARRNEPDAVKVLDFGLAKIQLPGTRGATLTQAGLVCGTPGYMSPEQWSGEPLDVRSDLYSVGVILYEMLTGRLPHEAETPMEMVRKHLTETIAPPSAYRGQGAVSPDLEALVMRALSAERDGRPASADAMREELLACVVAEPSAASVEPGRRTVVIPQRKSPSPAGAGRSTPARATPLQAEAPPAEGASGTPAPRGTPPKMAATVRLETPGATPRSTGADEERSLPSRRSRAPLIGAAVAAAVVVLGGGLYVASQVREERRAQDEARRREQEVARRAEEASRLRADELARRRATEEEARQRDEAEAKRRAEQARARAEAPPARPDPAAKRRAEESARRRAAEAKRPPRDDRFVSRSKLYSFALPPAADGKGVLSINAEPPGGDVLVNEVAYGPAPREILVPEGSYLVRVRLKTGEQTKQMKVRSGTREAWTAIFRTE
jgi:serine/threonine-protein kinase